MIGDPKIARRRLVALGLVVIAFVAGYFLWLRDSSLFAVHEVKVTGVTANAAEVTTALQGAAQGMSTLNIDNTRLREAVGRFPTVATIQIDPSPPHTLKITVAERLPIALVKAGGETVPVSADGYLLRGLRAGGQLPALELSQQPGGGARLAERDLEQAGLLGAAPPELRAGIKGSRFDSAQQGVVIDLASGIQLRMGDASAAAAKWAAAAAVLADPKLGTPAYIDVSVPNRPVSGG